MTVSQCIGRHLGQLLIDISAAMSADTRSTLDQDVGQKLVEYWPSINPHLGQVVFSCRSHNGQQSVEIALVVCRQCIDESLVKYQ